MLQPLSSSLKIVCIDGHHKNKGQGRQGKPLSLLLIEDTPHGHVTRAVRDETRRTVQAAIRCMKKTSPILCSWPVRR